MPALFHKMPESQIQMMLEIKNNHPILWMIVEKKPDISEVLAEVGAYLGLAMDGMYDIQKTCDDFYMKLRTMGASIIIPH